MDKSSDFKTFIQQMGGHLRTSHIMKIFEGFNDKDHPIDSRQQRDSYNKDHGRSATLFLNTKFKDNPLKTN